MRGTRWIIGPLVGVMLMSAVLTAGAADVTRATGQLIDRTGAKVGRVEVEQVADGARVIVEASGLTPGQHGIHVHAVGACAPAAFTTAGGHFNPLAKKHGMKHPEGAHGGDLPNLTSDAAGQARYSATSRLFTLSPGEASLFDADGAALVIHAGPDDEMTDPAGNSGDRVLCAVLTATPGMPRTGAGGLTPEPVLGMVLVGLLAVVGGIGLAWRRRGAV